jgi:endonuclease/exonuclease/phosphatase family metal-dependent hydrolase
MLKLAAAAVALVLAGCGPALVDGEEPLAEEDLADLEAARSWREAQSLGNTVRVVQCNVYKGGKYERYDREDLKTWGTARRFAESVDRYGRVDVIGVQEIDAAAVATVRKKLEAATGQSWQAVSATMGIGAATSSGIAIFWRPAVVDLVQSLGHVTIDRLPGNNYDLRFVGALLAQRSTGLRFGFFSGKLSWLDSESLRVREADRLSDWIAAKLKPHGDVSRVIATDLNAVLGSSTWKRMRSRGWDDGHATQPTAPALLPYRRIDYLWRAGPGAFVARPGRSPFFGSDHRFVWADVRLQ